MKKQKVRLISYTSDDEVIVVTPKGEKDMIERFFHKESGRNIQNYDREEHTSKEVYIRPKLYTS